MNLLETLSRAEAVVDLLRTNLAGDFAAELPTNAGPTLLEARQESGVAACELVAHLLQDARRELAARFAEEAANLPPKRINGRRPRESLSPAPARARAACNERVS